MIIRNGILSALVVGCLVGMLGCQSEQDALVEETPRPEAMAQPETTPRVDEPADTKTSLQESLQNQYEILDQKIQNLKTKAEEIPDEAKEKFSQMMQSLEKQKEVAKERLDVLANAASEVWEDVKDSAEEALNELQDIYDKLIAQFS